MVFTKLLRIALALLIINICSSFSYSAPAEAKQPEDKFDLWHR